MCHNKTKNKIIFYALSLFITNNIFAQGFQLHNDSVNSSIPIQYNGNYGSLFNIWSLANIKYIDSAINLNQVLTAGASATIAPNITIFSGSGLDLTGTGAGTSNSIYYKANNNAGDTCLYGVVSSTYIGSPAILKNYGFIDANAGIGLVSVTGSIRFGNVSTEFGRFDSATGVFHIEQGSILSGLAAYSSGDSLLLGGSNGLTAKLGIGSGLSVVSNNLTATGGVDSATVVGTFLTKSTGATYNFLNADTTKLADKLASNLFSGSVNAFSGKLMYTGPNGNLADSVLVVHKDTVEETPIISFDTTNSYLYTGNPLTWNNTTKQVDVATFGYIENQEISAQSARMWINGQAEFDSVVAFTGPIIWTGGSIASSFISDVNLLWNASTHRFEEGPGTPSGPFTIAANYVNGETITDTVIAFFAPYSGIYQLDMHVTIRTEATDSFIGRAFWTDPSIGPTNFPFYQQGSTNPNYLSVGVYAFPPQQIYVTAGSRISIAVLVSGGGSLEYDASAAAIYIP